MSELLPCPFCGGEAIYEVVSEPHTGWVTCRQCSGCVDEVMPKEEAIAAWNRRTPRYSHRNGETEPPTEAGWEPLRPGESVSDARGIKEVGIEIADLPNLRIFSYDGWFMMRLPDNIRLCRQKETNE